MVLLVLDHGFVLLKRLLSLSIIHLLLPSGASSHVWMHTLHVILLHWDTTRLLLEILTVHVRSHLPTTHNRMR